MPRRKTEALAHDEKILFGALPAKVQETTTAVEQITRRLSDVERSIEARLDQLSRDSQELAGKQLLNRIIENSSFTPEEKELISPVQYRTCNDIEELQTRITYIQHAQKTSKDTVTKLHNTFIDNFLALQAAIEKTPPKYKTARQITAELAAWGRLRNRSKPRLYKNDNNEVCISVGVPEGLLMRPDVNKYPCINNGGPVALRLGALDIMVNTRNGKVKITPARKDSFTFVGYGSNTVVHPHILGRGEPCLGDFLPPFREALDKGEFILALEVLFMFLGQAFTADPAGSKWIRMAMARIRSVYPNTPTTINQGDQKINGKTYTIAEDGFTVQEHLPAPMPRYSPQELDAVLSGVNLPDPKKIGLLWHPSHNVPPRIGMFIHHKNNPITGIRWIVKITSDGILTADNGITPWSTANVSVAKTLRRDIIQSPHDFHSSEDPHNDEYSYLIQQLIDNSMTTRSNFSKWVGDDIVSKYPAPECFRLWDGKTPIEVGDIVWDVSKNRHRLIVAIRNNKDFIFLSDNRLISDAKLLGHFLIRNADAFGAAPTLSPSAQASFIGMLKQTAYIKEDISIYSRLASSFLSPTDPLLKVNRWVDIPLLTDVPNNKKYICLLQTGAVEELTAEAIHQLPSDSRVLRIKNLSEEQNTTPNLAGTITETATELFIRDARIANPGQRIIITQEMARELTAIPPDVEVM